MADDDLSMDEFLCFKEKSTEEDKYFTKEKTLKLLELYKKYNKRLGSFEIKSKKKLWEVIAKDLSNEYRLTIPPSKCENKFKVLDRNYKKTVDHNNQSGRGRKICEFEEEMDDIYEKKKNLKPTLLLSSSNVESSKAPLKESEGLVISISEFEPEPQPSCSYADTHKDTSNVEAPKVEATPQKLSLKRKRVLNPSSSYQKRNDILVEMKNDLKMFYDRKNKREEQKLAIAKKRQEDREKRDAMAREYLDFIKKKD